MAFPDQAESWASKLHLRRLRVPAVVGVVGISLVLAGYALLTCTGLLAPSSDSFQLQHAEAPAESVSVSNGDAPASGERPSQQRVVVHVAGAVVSPGVRDLPEGARVQDAVDAAGGLSPEAQADAVNLARTLSDGEQVYIPTIQEAQAQDGASVSSATAEAGSSGALPPSNAPNRKVNINRASAGELEALPGIGPSTAQKIVADRDASGPFASIDDLQRVAGIGQKKLDGIRDLICV